MEIELRFFATFRQAVGSKTIEREVDDGADVGVVLRALEAEFDGLEGEILDDAGELRPQLSVLKNGREVVHMSGLATPLEDGDAVSVFPPVAGGSGESTEDERERITREKAFRGISERLARHYLVNLGGEEVDDHVVVGPDWRVETSAEKVNVAGSMTLTEVTVTFEGPPETLDPLMEKFGRKAMRAGG
jgi:MoaD family protein|nr:ubiquitin-like small modifier protein 1 [Haloglomus salinum]